MTISDMHVPVSETKMKKISRKVHNLIEINQPTLEERSMIRTVMDGGKDAVALLLSQKVANHSLDLPVPNLMLSAGNRLAYKLGKVPMVRITEPDHINSQRAKEYADKRARIVRGWDYQNKLRMMYPQIGRWLPGYGFISVVHKQMLGRNGQPYPYIELRDPYEAYPGEWGSNQQPPDMAYVRVVRPETLAEMFPEHRQKFAEMAAGFSGFNTGQASPIAVNHRTTTTGLATWENQSGNGIAVYEYYDNDGVWWTIPEINLVLLHIPNFLDSGPMFTAAKRFSFNKLSGQYNHIIGLLAALARINLNLMIAIEDSVHSETNIHGEFSGKYKRGRGQVNRFPPGTNVDRPKSPVPFEAFQQANRLDEQLRIIANYPVQEDSVSPNSFVTGRGLEELRSSVSQEVQEYYTVMSDWQEEVDYKRFEFCERLYPNRKLKVNGENEGAPYTETYTPKTHIAGNFFTSRRYGMMTGWDEPTQVITGLQLVQAEAIDMDTFRDNVDGIINPEQVAKKVEAQRAQNLLMEQVAMLGQQGDPRAMEIIVEMLPEGPLKNKLADMFIPTEEELAAQQQAQGQDPMAALMGGGQAPPIGGPGLGGPESTQTILERLTSSGEPFTGIQTVRGGS